MRTGPHKLSPAGMEPLGSERHRPWPVRVSFREKANQSKCASTNYPKSLSHTGYTKRPRREWSRWEASDMDGARQGERTGVSESIEDLIHSLPKESHAHWITQSIPGGNGAAGKRSKWTNPEGRTSGSEQVNRSNG